jgi:hypothetical protein
MRHLEKSMTKVIDRALTIAKSDKTLAPFLTWVEGLVNEEFFETREAAAEHLKVSENRELIVNSGFFKLNFGVSARLSLNKDECDAYYECLKQALLIELAGDVSQTTIDEILNFCRGRNFIANLIAGDNHNSFSVNVSEETSRLTHLSGYLRHERKTLPNEISFELDPMTAKQIQDYVSSVNKPLTFFSVSQVYQMNWGRTYMEAASFSG